MCCAGSLPVGRNWTLLDEIADDKAAQTRLWAEGRAKEKAAHLAFFPPHGAADGYLLAYLHFARAISIENELARRPSAKAIPIMGRVCDWLAEREAAGETRAINVSVTVSTRDLPKPRQPGDFIVMLAGGGKRRQAIVNEAMGDNEFGSVMAGILDGLRPPLEGSYLPAGMLDRGMPLIGATEDVGGELEDE